MGSSADTACLNALLGPKHRELGEAPTASLVALGGSVTLIGTSAGSLLAYAVSTSSLTVTTAADLQSELLFAQRIHCGPVHDVTLSCTQLIAVCGHDAACTVLSLGDLLAVSAQSPTASVSRSASAIGAGASAAVVSVRRLCGHRMPVVCARFLSDGCTLASVAVDGQLIVFDAMSGATLARVRCGFPARTLALSADESMCYVGGRRLARIDLFHALRAEEGPAYSAGPYRPEVGDVDDAPQPWLRLCCWPGLDGNSGRRVYDVEEGCFLRELRVSQADGSLTAFVARKVAASEEGTSRETVVATASWHFRSSDPCVAEVYKSVEDPNAFERHLTGGGGNNRWGSVWDLTRCIGLADAAASEGHPEPFVLSEPWFTSIGPARELKWRDATVRVQRSAKSTGRSKAVGTSSRLQQLVVAKAQQQVLQQQCDALAQRLREALQRKGAKR